jgi:hypothetical protein
MQGGELEQLYWRLPFGLVHLFAFDNWHNLVRVSTRVFGTSNNMGMVEREGEKKKEKKRR